MTPEQALKILDSITAQMRMSRQEHETAIKAVEVIKAELKKNVKD